LEKLNRSWHGDLTFCLAAAKMFWGISEARDFYDDYVSGLKRRPEKLDILCFGLGDPSHVLKTIARIDGATEINFFIVEGCAELMARDLLLMTIPLEPQDYFSVNAKTHLYLDLFGNSLLRSSSSMYLTAKSETFIKCITDLEFAESAMPMFKFNELKYKERDQLEMAFTFWKNKKEHVYDIQKYWNDQNRLQLKERFDHRDGAFDWDLQMKLRSNGAKQLCPQEYKHWRETGVAFTFPEFENSLPNKTFAMDLRKNGQQWFHRGYVGDMTVGPYIAFGLDCAEEKMLKSNFGTNECRATDVSERNLYEMMWEIANGRKYDAASDNKNFRKYGAVKLQINDSQPVERGFADTDVNVMKLEKPLKCFDNVKIHFLSIEDVLNITKKQRKFDVAFIAHNYFTFLKPDFADILNDQALLLFETKKYSLLKPAEINEGIDQIKKFCKELQLKAITSFSLNIINSILKYKKDSTSQ